MPENRLMREFNDYTDFVESMKVYPEQYKIIYPTLGLTGEAGEIAEKVKKWLRGDRELDKQAILLELGDPLFYITAIATDLGYTLQDVVDANVVKLSVRKDKNLIKGDGDTRGMN
jgi:NTP pyrophosphatase (non-canonical NTP hydrolase)